MLLALFLIDAVLVAITSVILVFALGRELHGLIAHFAAWMVGCLFLIASVGILLGACGLLSANGFLLMHVFLFGLVFLIRRKSLKNNLLNLRRSLSSCWMTLGSDSNLRAVILGLGLFYLVSAFFAATGQIAIYDSMTYRLSRVAHWLQEGAIRFFETNDERQNHMPVVPDLVMAWILGASKQGYAGSALAQWWGGGLLLFSTIGIARQIGLSRFAAVSAAWLTAGAGNVALQFTTTQTDLFTAGLITSSFFLWRSNARLKKGSILAGITAGMAIGSKGTVFYLLPSLGVMSLWFAWRTQLPIRAWIPSVVAGILSLSVFFGPEMTRNWIHYENPLGPEEFVDIHHQNVEGRWIEKTALNLASTLIQNMEPHSQMPGLGVATKALGLSLVGLLPEEDPFTFRGESRSKILSLVMTIPRPDADVTTFGAVLLVLLAGGFLTALRSPENSGREDLLLVYVGLLIFIIFFHAMQQWHPYGHRYFIIIAPWIGIAVAWFIEQSPRWARRPIWAVSLVSVALTATNLLATAHNAGYPASFRPEDSAFSLVQHSWTKWINELTTENEPIYVALPFDRALTPFYRRESQGIVTLIKMSQLENSTIEEIVNQLNGAWLFTEAHRFEGKEGEVERYKLLFNEDPLSGFSVAAYRKNQQGANTLESRLPSDRGD